MGYACPVCESPQRDGEHLANHLAFTAMLGDEAHEDWLDEHAPGWGGTTPEKLAGRVLEHAAETEYHEVFEDTVDRRGRARGGTERREHEHGSEQIGPDIDPDAARRRSEGSLDAETRDVLREAQEMTQELLEAEDTSDGAADNGRRADGAESDSDEGKES